MKARLKRVEGRAWNDKLSVKNKALPGKGSGGCRDFGEKSFKGFLVSNRFQP